MRSLVFLKLTSWRGVSIGAEHWYARLEWSSGRREVQRELLTAAEVQALNEKDQHATYRLGDTSHRFDLRWHALAAGMRAFAHEFERGSVLLLGDPAYGVMGCGGFLLGPARWEAEIRMVIGRGRYRAEDHLMQVMHEDGLEV